MTVADCFDHDPGLVPVAEAQRRLRERVTIAVGRERVAVGQAHGRILAEALVADRDIPAFDNVAVDGWALRWQPPMAERPFRLPVARGRSAAGAPHMETVPEGQALRVLTGAVLPAGTDTVVLQEECRVEDGELVLPILRRGGGNRRPRGEDMATGDTVLRSGRILRAPDLGAAALLGLADVCVFERLSVAVLSTGNEVTEPGMPLPQGGLYDANRPILMGALASLPVKVTDLGRLDDNPRHIADVLGQAASDHHLILTSGGASQGDEDHLAQTIERMGRLRFWRIAIKPGRPLAFGEIGTSRIMGLPGNPVAATLCFAYLARPLLLAMAGAGWHAPRGLLLPFARAMRKRPGRTELVRVRLVDGPDGPLMENIGKQGSGVLTSLTEADGVAELGDDVTDIQPGDRLPFLSLAELGLA
ncbi:MAG: molybdopterin molybdotransferase MoeA [Geminicoccaceae bacterium]|nr:molybdopterin molybdotransferase MoeA [Geminicoccaceae bacterium]